MYKVAGNPDFGWCDIILRNGKIITIFDLSPLIHQNSFTFLYNFQVEFVAIAEVKKYILLRFSDYKDLDKLFELLEEEADV